MCACIDVSRGEGVRMWDEIGLSARHWEKLFFSTRYQEAEIVWFSSFSVIEQECSPTSSVGLSLAAVVKTFIRAVVTLKTPLIFASLRRSAYLFFFLHPPSTFLIGRRVAQAPASFPSRAAVPLSSPRWMQGGRMPSQLAGESESFIDSTWPREEHTYLSSSWGGNRQKARERKRDHPVSSRSCLCVHKPRLVPLGCNKPAEKNK